MNIYSLKMNHDHLISQEWKKIELRNLENLFPEARVFNLNAMSFKVISTTKNE
jgi:hypothetical protein